MNLPLFSTDLSPENIDRRDFILLTMEKHGVSGRVLEIGCGNGKYGRLLHDHVDSYVGVDVDEEYLLAAMEGHAKNEWYVNAFCPELPFNGPFDVVLFGRSLHYSYTRNRPRELDRLLKDTRRILHPEGICIVVEPNEEITKWNAPILQPGHENFIPKSYHSKREGVKRTRAYLATQDVLEVCSFEKSDFTSSYRCVLKHFQK